MKGMVIEGSVEFIVELMMRKVVMRIMRFFLCLGIVR